MAKAYGIKSVVLLEKSWGTPCELDGNKLVIIIIIIIIGLFLCEDF
jgi:hypothetical protein